MREEVRSFAETGRITWTGELREGEWIFAVILVMA